MTHHVQSQSSDDSDDLYYKEETCLSQSQKVTISAFALKSEFKAKCTQGNQHKLRGFKVPT